MLWNWSPLPWYGHAMQTFTAPGSNSRCTNDVLRSSGVSEVLSDAQQLIFDPRESEAEVRLCSGRNVRMQSKLTVWVKHLPWRSRTFCNTGLNYLSTPVKMHWLLFSELKWGLQPPSAALFSVRALFVKVFFHVFALTITSATSQGCIKRHKHVKGKKKKSLTELHPHVRAKAKKKIHNPNNVSRKRKTVTSPCILLSFYRVRS